MILSCPRFSSLCFDFMTSPFLSFVWASPIWLFTSFNFFHNISSSFLTLSYCLFSPSFLPPFLTVSLLTVFPLLTPTMLSPLLSTTASASLFHYQISACESGLNTWNTSQRSVKVSPQTSSSPWSGSLSCSARPTRCFVPETWVPLSATSSSQS